MFKQITTVAVLSSAILFGGASLHSADASAQDQGQSQPYKIYYSTNYSWNNLNQDSDFSNMFKNCFSWQNHSDQAAQNQGQNTQSQKAPEKQQAAQQKPAKQQTQETVQQKPAKQQAQQAEKQPAKQQTTEQSTEDQKQSASSKQQGLSDYEQQVVDLTNQERAKEGLKPLKADVELSKVAREKSHDMAVNGYFSHNSPTYGSPFDMMKSWGISYNTAGENIAKGQKTPQEVVNAWMNSEGHRANIMNPKFTKIGVGYSSQGNIWTQQFIG
ncbi:CAP domain-containing protein [Virgibacillus halophilus]|uniref:CAP domain-containing protein n=1 Tax=Tigheibacillus halophilus TaxID=361280 RepID=A0ABU5C9Q7_9BACI|nr:CAP domain-containing protein [Virgibacillus halophilus]